MRAKSAQLLFILAVTATPAHAQAGVEENVGPQLLSLERLRALPPKQSLTWGTYASFSNTLHLRDTSAMRRELNEMRQSAMSKAPYAAPDFRYGERELSWLKSDSARTLATSVLTWQTETGGWSKRTDMWQPRKRGTSYYSETETWHYTPTFDNGATTGQIRFLAEMASVTGDATYMGAFSRGLELVYLAQQPNGCWPQTYPLEGGYHDAVTFNDDVAVLILRVLDDVARGKWDFIANKSRDHAREVASAGVACLVRAQVLVNGVRTVWGQQHDPVTLEIVPARSYELAGLAGRESASIMMYLMSLSNPNADVIRAVNAAAVWFRAHAITGFRYDGYGLTRDNSSGPFWPRLTEISTDRPIFANRDGIKLYDWEKLTDRRSGYGWFGTEPAQALARYEEWSRAHKKAL